MILALLSPSESPSFWGWPAAASIGGVFVFIGLWMERGIEKHWFSNIKDLKRQRCKESLGWKILMVGILIEIGIGFAIAVKDEIENIKTKIEQAKLEPRRLNAAKINELANFLRLKETLQGANVGVLYPEWDPEAERFAMDISQAFDSIGMKVKNGQPQPINEPIFDLKIMTNMMSPNSSILAKKIALGFERIGLSAKASGFSPPVFGEYEQSSNDVYVFVGSKYDPKLDWRGGELSFDDNGNIKSDWGSGVTQIIKPGGIHVSALDGNRTAVRVEFNRPLEYTPVLRGWSGDEHRAASVMGERGTSFSWDFVLPYPPPKSGNTNWHCLLDIIF
jgi:hypothetical protein